MPTDEDKSNSPSLSDLVATAQYIEQLINAEMQWISNRLSWLFISQTFCLATHAVLITAQAVPKPIDYGILLWAMPVFGILSCAIVFWSVLAAQTVSLRLANERSTITERINVAVNASIPRIGANPSTRDAEILWTKNVGSLTHLVLPPALALLWSLLFVARFLSCTS